MQKPVEISLELLKGTKITKSYYIYSAKSINFIKNEMLVFLILKIKLKN